MLLKIPNFIRICCGSAYVKGGARKYQYIIAHQFKPDFRQDGAIILKATGNVVGPYTSLNKTTKVAIDFAKTTRSIFLPGYGSLHNVKILMSKNNWPYLVTGDRTIFAIVDGSEYIIPATHPKYEMAVKILDSNLSKSDFEQYFSDCFIKSIEMRPLNKEGKTKKKTKTKPKKLDIDAMMEMLEGTLDITI